MNKSTAVALVLASMVLALLGAAVAGYMKLSNRIEIAEMHRQSAETKAGDLEKQVGELTETAQLCEERGRELSTLRNQAAELEKQVAELKTRPANNSTFTLQGNWQQPAAGGLGQPQMVWGLNGDMQNGQVRDALRHVQIDLNGATVRVDDGAVQPNIVFTNPPVVDKEIIDIIGIQPAAAGAPAAETTGPQVETTRRIRATRRLTEQILNGVDDPKPVAPTPKPKPTEEQF